MRRAEMFAARRAVAPISVQEVAEIVAAGAAAALGHAARGERGAAVTLLIALDAGFSHPHPRVRRFVRAQIHRVELALGLPHVAEIDADLARAESA